MSITVAMLEKLLVRSKEKKDGVWSYEGHIYGVKDGRLHFVSDGSSIYQFNYGFLTEVGKVDYGRRDKIRKLIKEGLRRA